MLRMPSLQLLYGRILLSFWGAIHHAVSKQQYRMVEHVIACGCDINLQTMDKDTALHIACERGDIDMIATLLKGKGIDIELKNAAGVLLVFSYPHIMWYAIRLLQKPSKIC